jgi:DNA-binding NarL/FixJ family response regulator
MMNALVKARPLASARTFAGFSSKEIAILQGLKEGLTDREISFVVGLSEKTVNYYMRQLTTKLGARNRTHALVKALQMGLVSLN